MREAAIATLFEGEMQELEDVIAASEFRLKKTASANEALAKQNAVLMEDAKALTGKVADCDAQSDRQRAENDQLRGELQTLHSLYKAREDGVDPADAPLEMTQVTQEEISRDIRLAKVTQEGRTAAAKLAIMESKLEDAKGKLVEATGKLATAEINASQSTNELESLRQQYETLKAKLAKAKCTGEQLDQRIHLNSPGLTRAP